MAKPRRIGGSFAPQMTDQLLEAYDLLIQHVQDPKIKESALLLLQCVEHWWKLPESEGTAQRVHPVGVGVIVPLSQPIMDQLWDDIPWDDELDLYQRRFNDLPPGVLRDACFHLLWFVKELNQDREPITNDLL